MSEQLALQQHTLLRPLSPIACAAVKKFVAAEVFEVGAVVGGHKIGSLSGKFRTDFLDVVEEDVPTVDVKRHTLMQDSPDPPIIAEMGGEANAVSKLCRVHQMMGAKGVSLENGYINVVYIYSNGVLWAVYWWIQGGEWHLEAYPISDSAGWCFGFRFFGG